MLNLNINKGQFSLRSYLNFESDLSKKQDYDPRFRVYNLYLEGRNLFDIATIKIGRQPIFNSIAGGGVFDGVDLDLRYSDFKLSGYYGGNTPAYQKFETTKNWNDDYILGGKFTTSIIKNTQIGLSYINKNFRPLDYYATRFDANLNPMQVLIEGNSNQFKFASADVSYRQENMFSLDARYDYDLNFETTSKFEVSGRYEQIENLGVDLYYNYREPRIRYNSIFSVFDFGNTQEIEGGLDYRFFNQYTVFGKFANVTYKDDNSQRITAGINTNYGSLSYRKNLGYAGEMDAISLYGAYSMMDGFFTPSLGLAYTSYKLSKEDAKNNLTSVLAGFNLRPWKALSFDLQGQYLNNRIYKDDFRLFFKINYWFNTNLKLI
ncbi:MAG: hypothetical protein HF300_11135 [Ignavibacteria bacterium]|jgi:hypothetical protein|nr:hypothetical protein [Ignavibacteria bacterium]MCU7513105.1 hypothetical protein [Ignavibacteria bacterium]MCU7524876.1 hypothetical protein [Ignavibacteria bacterium]